MEKKLATVIIENGVHKIKLPNGEILEGVIKTIITSEQDYVPIATISILVKMGE